MLSDGSWLQSDYVDISLSRNAYRYSVPRAQSDGRRNITPGIAVSVEEKVSDLVQSYPHLKSLLKSHSKDGNARLRDLTISSQERDQLLLQIIAARRQQQFVSGAIAPAPLAARSLPPRVRSQQPRRKKPAQVWPKAFSSSAQLGMVTGKWHKRLWG